MWYRHENENELFYVLKGNFNMEYRNKTVISKQRSPLRNSYFIYVYCSFC